MILFQWLQNQTIIFSYSSVTCCFRPSLEYIDTQDTQFDDLYAPEPQDQQIPVTTLSPGPEPSDLHPTTPEVTDSNEVKVTDNQVKVTESPVGEKQEDEQTDYETAKTRAVQTDISRVCVKYQDTSKYNKFRIHKQILREFLACRDQISRELFRNMFVIEWFAGINCIILLLQI